MGNNLVRNRKRGWGNDRVGIDEVVQVFGKGKKGTQKKDPQIMLFYPSPRQKY